MTQSFRIVLICCTLILGATVGGATAPISLDVRDIDIYDAVRLLSTQAAINVVIDSSVQHRPVTLRLQNVTFDEALATIVQANDLESVRVGNIIYLGGSDAINRRYPSVPNGAASRIFQIHNAVPEDIAHAIEDALPHGTVIVTDHRTSTIVITGSRMALEHAGNLISALDAVSATSQSVTPMRYVKASDALKALQATLSISPPASVFASDQQNEIIVTGSDDFIAQAKAIVAKVDRPGQQVRYEVRVTDITPSDNSNIGVLIGGAGSQPGVLSSSFLTNSYALNVTLNALIVKNEATILARPTLSSLNNVPASLLVGEQYPIVYFDARTGTQQVQFVNIGVNLNVTPTIGSDGSITTDLETDYSQVAGLNAQGFPIITTRKAQSTLRVHNNETIVIAGLFSDIDQSTLTKIPFLGDIPFVGQIFRNRQKNKSKDEVVFLITPHLVADDDPAKGNPPAGVPAR